MLIPVSKPDLSSLEEQYATDAIKSGWISSKGNYIGKFENAWASYNGYKYGVAVNSGTNALFIALKALGIGKGDEVIVPDFTMVATAWAVTYCGATPIFVDCTDNLTIDTAQIESKITERTKVIMPVHIYGRQCDMKSIMRIAYEYNLCVVEDMAEAHGIKPVGDIGCYSFFGNKIITTGEGGMCITNDKRLAQQMEHLKSMAFDEGHTFLHKKIGYNHRMTNVQAAIGLAQVERIGEILEKRRNIESLYDKHLPAKYKMPFRDVLWMYDIDCGGKRDEIRKILTEKGIDTRLFFKPMSMQPMYHNWESGNAYEWSKRGLYLPTFNDLTEEEIIFICDTIKNI